jgi:caffeoyl-CoA O-methyltransferase
MSREPVVFPAQVQAGIQAYLNTLLVDETPTQQYIREMTEAEGLPPIDLRPYEGQFLAWLAQVVGAKRIVEIGTLAGYSAAWLARALPEDGKLYCMELEQRNADIARSNLEKAGLLERVEIIVGNAHENLKTLPGPFDMVFIDAEKEGNPEYLAWAVANTRPGGIIAVHNALQRGSIVDENPPANARVMLDFNKQMAENPRLLTTLYPAGDGLIIGVVRDKANA